MKEEKTRAYISGPVTGNENYMQQFEEAEQKIRSCGFDVINPAKVLKPLEDVLTYDQCMALCMELLDCADCIVMLDGWKDSRGANREYGFADGRGMDIYNISVFQTTDKTATKGA